MRDFHADHQTALANPLSRGCWFVWLTVKNRTTHAPSSFGFSDLGVRATVNVKDGLTGATASRPFSPRLHDIGPIRYVSDLTIRTVEVELDNLDPTVEVAIRGLSPKRAPIQIYRGQLTANTQNSLVAPAEPLFVGFVDETPITTGAINQAGSLRLVCVSHALELRRTNTETRSNASQKLRNPNDNLYRYTQVVGDWELDWNGEKGSAGSSGGGGGGGGSNVSGNVNQSKKLLKGLGLGGFLP